MYEIRQKLSLKLCKYKLSDIFIYEGWLEHSLRKKFFVLIELGSIIDPSLLKYDTAKNLQSQEHEEVKKEPPKKQSVEEQKKISKESLQSIPDVENLFGITISNNFVDWQENLWRTYGLDAEAYNDKHLVLSTLALLFNDQFQLDDQ